MLNFGPKIRKEFPKGMSLTELVKRRFGTGILKIILILILFYLMIFLIAEVTAIAFFIKFNLKNSFMDNIWTNFSNMSFVYTERWI